MVSLIVYVDTKILNVFSVLHAATVIS